MGTQKKEKLILIVEDNYIDAHIAESMINNLDETIRVHHCINGQKALEFLYKLKGLQPDLIFLDINMPIMDGKEFLARKQVDKEIKSIPVVMLSSSGLFAEKNECLTLGAKDFIEKPVTKENISKLLTQLSVEQYKY